MKHMGGIDPDNARRLDFNPVLIFILFVKQRCTKCIDAITYRTVKTQ